MNNYRNSPQCTVRRTTAREERRGRSTGLRKCIRLFKWRAVSPGHDELRCVLFLINGTVISDHFREQVSSTPLGTVRSSSYPVQTLVVR